MRSSIQQQQLRYQFMERADKALQLAALKLSDVEVERLEGMTGPITPSLVLKLADLGGKQFAQDAPARKALIEAAQQFLSSMRSEWEKDPAWLQDMEKAGWFVEVPAYAEPEVKPKKKIEPRGAAGSDVKPATQMKRAPLTEKLVEIARTRYVPAALNKHNSGLIGFEVLTQAEYDALDDGKKDKKWRPYTDASIARLASDVLHTAPATLSGAVTYLIRSKQENLFEASSILNTILDALHLSEAEKAELQEAYSQQRAARSAGSGKAH